MPKPLVEQFRWMQPLTLSTLTGCNLMRPGWHKSFVKALLPAMEPPRDLPCCRIPALSMSLMCREDNLDTLTLEIGNCSKIMAELR